MQEYYFRTVISAVRRRVERLSSGGGGSLMNLLTRKAGEWFSPPPLWTGSNVFFLCMLLMFNPLRKAMGVLPPPPPQRPYMPLPEKDKYIQKYIHRARPENNESNLNSRAISTFYFGENGLDPSSCKFYSILFSQPFIQGRSKLEAEHIFFLSRFNFLY